MRLDVTDVNLSSKDLKKDIGIPDRINSDLAEDIGAMMGDGCICYRKYKNEYELSLVGHVITDWIYVNVFIKNLKRKLFNIDYNFIERPRINTCVIRTYSEGLFEFYTKTIGLPIGSKNNSRIPELIMNSKKYLKRAFLRGLVDTDMTLVFKKSGRNELTYPVIKMNSSNKNFVKDICMLLKDTEFRPSVSYDMISFHKGVNRSYITNGVYLNGKSNLKNG